MGPQNPKQCKKRTPDYVDGNPKKGKVQIGFKVKVKVTIIEKSEMHQTGTAAFRIPTKSLLQDIVVSGEYVFDSYDEYDNTCYITKENSDFTYNVLLTDIKLTQKL